MTGRKVRVSQPDHDAALTICNWHRDLLTDEDDLACNDVARGWGNNELVDAASFERFSAKRAEVAELVRSGQRFWCGCGCEDRRVMDSPRSPAKREPSKQQQRAAEIQTRFPTEEVDAWIIANTKYTAETFAALGKATRRDRRREARRQMSENAAE